MEQHNLADFCDAPPIVTVERRHTPDRRTDWRGGRRDTDWLSRPIGAWDHLQHIMTPWRQWVARGPLGYLRH